MLEKLSSKHYYLACVTNELVNRLALFNLAIEQYIIVKVTIVYRPMLL